MNFHQDLTRSIVLHTFNPTDFHLWESGNEIQITHEICCIMHGFTMRERVPCGYRRAFNAQLHPHRSSCLLNYRTNHLSAELWPESVRDWRNHILWALFLWHLGHKTDPFCMRKGGRGWIEGTSPTFSSLTLSQSVTSIVDRIASRAHCFMRFFNNPSWSVVVCDKLWYIPRIITCIPSYGSGVLQ